MIKTMANLVSGEYSTGLVDSCLLTVSSHGLVSVCDISGISFSSYKVTSPF